MNRRARTTPDQLRRAPIRSWAEGKLLDSMRTRTHSLHGARKQAAIGAMRGTIVELGPGTGVNMPYYAPDVHVIAIEPNPNMHRVLRERADKHGVDLDIRPSQGERLDIDDDTAGFERVDDHLVDPGPAWLYSRPHLIGTATG